jgi:hypothetical protein
MPHPFYILHQLSETALACFCVRGARRATRASTSSQMATHCALAVLVLVASSVHAVAPEIPAASVWPLPQTMVRSSLASLAACMAYGMPHMNDDPSDKPCAQEVGTDLLLVDPEILRVNVTPYTATLGRAINRCGAFYMSTQASFNVLRIHHSSGSIMVHLGRGCGLDFIHMQSELVWDVRTSRVTDTCTPAHGRFRAALRPSSSAVQLPCTASPPLGHGSSSAGQLAQLTKLTVVVQNPHAGVSFGIDESYHLQVCGALLSEVATIAPPIAPPL